MLRDNLEGKHRQREFNIECGIAREFTYLYRRKIKRKHLDTFICLDTPSFTPSFYPLVCALTPFYVSLGAPS